MRNLFINVCSGLGLCLFFLIACSSSEEPKAPTYQELINQGWTAFSQDQYETAANSFSQAKSKNPNEAGAYTGLGWCSFKLDDLIHANTEFDLGSTKSNPSADLYAGWAFVLNAQKDYANSNIQADQALANDLNWGFAHELSLDINDLHVLKAENYYLLGNFSQSLMEVQILNPDFNVDLTNSEGQSELAAEIERLKGVS